MAKRRTRGRGQRTPAIQAKAQRMIDKWQKHYDLGYEACHAKETKGTSTKDFADSHGMNEHFTRKLKLFARAYRRGDLKALRKLRPNGPSRSSGGTSTIC